MVPTSKRKIVEIGTPDAINTHIHDCSLSWIDTGTLINRKRGGV